MPKSIDKKPPSPDAAIKWLAKIPLYGDDIASVATTLKKRRKRINKETSGN